MGVGDGRREVGAGELGKEGRGRMEEAGGEETMEEDWGEEIIEGEVEGGREGGIGEGRKGWQG